MARELAGRSQWLDWMEIGGDARAFIGLVATIMVLLVSLVPLTGLWPNSLSGRWILPVAAWMALDPVVVVITMLLRLFAEYWRKISLTSEVKGP